MTLLDWIILAILVIAGILGLIFGAKKNHQKTGMVSWICNSNNVLCNAD